MERIRITVGMSLIMVSLVGYSQSGPFGYYRDALFFSRSNSLVGSSARIRGIGGAQVALGGDISVTATNPAGLGFFNRNIFSITPSINFTTSDTEYLGTTQKSFKNNLHFSNIGTVINFTKGDYTKDKFKGGSLGISLSRKNSYGLERTYEARNNSNSIIDYFIESAGMRAPADQTGFIEGAFDQYIINPTFDANDNISGYDSFVPGFPLQTESVKENGTRYALNLAWGGNYDDRLYFGGGMEIQILNYKQRKNYVESTFLDGNTPEANLNSLSVVDELSVRGQGINFNIGAIFRPVDFMTVGISYTTPTFLSLEDESFFDIVANWNEGSQFIDGNDTVNLNTINPFRSNFFTSKYILRTPARLSIGTALYVGKNGFITGEVALVDYSNSNLKSDDFSEAADNDLIEQLYTSVINIKVGGEYRFDQFRLRAGYAILPGAFRNSSAEDVSNLTFGFGYRTSDYFLDFAVVRSNSNQSYSPYDINTDQPIARSEIKNTAASVTFGLVF